MLGVYFVLLVEVYCSGVVYGNNASVEWLLLKSCCAFMYVKLFCNDWEFGF